MNVREWALPVYTILMELAVGALLVLWVIRLASGKRFSPDQIDRIIRNPLMVILVTVALAMVGAHFHLSRPFYSFYAVRNLRTSWLSREVLFTVIFFWSVITLWLLSRYRPHRRDLIGGLGWLTVVIGLISVYCMARIYLLPTQLAWNSTGVIISFYGTALLLGCMAIACLLVLDLKFAEVQQDDHIDLHSQVIDSTILWLAGASFGLAIFEIAMTGLQLQHMANGGPTLQTSLQLIIRLYAPLFIARLLLLSGTPLWMGYSILRLRRSGLISRDLMTPVYFSCLLLLVAEIIGRFLFYATHIRVGI